jgi:hypothetical protein
VSGSQQSVLRPSRMVMLSKRQIVIEQCATSAGAAVFVPDSTQSTKSRLGPSQTLTSPGMIVLVSSALGSAQCEPLARTCPSHSATQIALPGCSAAQRIVCHTLRQRASPLVVK